MVSFFFWYFARPLSEIIAVISVDENKKVDIKCESLLLFECHCLSESEFFFFAIFYVCQIWYWRLFFSRPIFSILKSSISSRYESDIKCMTLTVSTIPLKSLQKKANYEFIKKMNLLMNMINSRTHKHTHKKEIKSNTCCHLFIIRLPLQDNRELSIYFPSQPFQRKFRRHFFFYLIYSLSIRERVMAIAINVALFTFHFICDSFWKIAIGLCWRFFWIFFFFYVLSFMHKTEIDIRNTLYPSTLW